MEKANESCREGYGERMSENNPIKIILEGTLTNTRRRIASEMDRSTGGQSVNLFLLGVPMNSSYNSEDFSKHFPRFL